GASTEARQRRVPQPPSEGDLAAGRKPAIQPGHRPTERPQPAPYRLGREKYRRLLRAAQVPGTRVSPGSRIPAPAGDPVEPRKPGGPGLLAAAPRASLPAGPGPFGGRAPGIGERHAVGTPPGGFRHGGPDGTGTVEARRCGA